MMTQSTTWVSDYLQSLLEDTRFGEARSFAPLWLAREHSGGERQAARLTVQMAAELCQRMVIVGPAGAGKTTTLRQFAAGLAETIIGEDRTKRHGDGRPQTPLPIYIQLASFNKSIIGTLASASTAPPPPLEALAATRPLLLLLDGLDELPPTAQLSALSSISSSIATLGPQARWIATCRTESMALFRPWLVGVDSWLIQPLRTADILAFVRQRRSDALADWLGRGDDLVRLATRPRWLAALLDLTEGETTAQRSRGRLMAEWVPAVASATLSAHATNVTTAQVVDAMPEIAAALDSRHTDTIALSEAVASIEANGQIPGGYEALHELIGAGILRAPSATSIIQALIGASVLSHDQERQTVSFRHPLLRSFAQGMLLARQHPSSWQTAMLTRSWGDAVLFSYCLCEDREAALRRLIASGNMALTARCLIDVELPDEFETLLARSGNLTPPLRVLLADSFAADGLRAAALEQLDRAASEGYDEAGLFGRLGDLYSAAGQWRHARAAFEQALLRDADDLRYRQQFGVVCSRLGELDHAATALEAVLETQQRRSAATAHELGYVLDQQGRGERALDIYRLAASYLPSELSYRRSIAGALRRLGRAEEARDELLQLIERNGDPDVDSYAELGQVYRDLSEPALAASAYGRAVSLAPNDAQLYARLSAARADASDLPAARRSAMTAHRATELAPTDAQLHAGLAQLLEQAGDAEAALVSYRHAARLNPRSEVYLRRLGALLRDRGEDEEATAVLRAALELRPDSADTHSELAALLWRQSSFDEALDAYRRARALAPESAHHEHQLGAAYGRLGQNQLALRHFRQAAQLAPDRAALHAAVAESALANDDIDAALISAKHAAALAPESPDYARVAASLHLRVGDTARARAIFAQLLRRDRRDPRALADTGRLHLALGRWSRAGAAFTRALHDRQDPVIAAELGYALLQQGRYELAAAALERALRATPDDPPTLLRYSTALDALGISQQALDVARHAANVAPGNAEIQQHAGVLAMRVGQHDAALTLLDRAVALDSTRASAHLARARILLGDGQHQPALESARAAVAVDPSHEPEFVLGQVLLALGDSDKALQALQRASALDPACDAVHGALRDLHASAGQIDSALEHARRASWLNQRHDEHKLRLGELLVAGDQPLEARGLLEMLLLSHETEAKSAAPERAASGRRGIVATIHATLARAELRLHNMDDARASAFRAIAIAPDTADHHYALGQVELQDNRLEAAARSFAHAAELAPDRAELHHALGTALLRSGAASEALPHLRRAAARGENSDYIRDLASGQAAAGEHAAAAETMARALKLRPDRQEWTIDLAEIQIARGWHDEALSELGRIAPQPDSPRFFRLRAEALYARNRRDAARADLIDVLRRDPQDGRAYALFARLLLDDGSLTHALDAARRAVSYPPVLPEHRAILAAVLRASGDRVAAAEQLSAALAERPQPAWWTEIAADYTAIGDDAAATDAWQRAVAAAPRDAEARYQLARQLAGRRQHADAAQQLREAVALKPHFAAAQAALAEMLAFDSSISPDVPLNHARRAVTLAPQRPEHWRILGEILSVAGDLDEAVNALRRAHELAPEDARTAYLLGRALYRTRAHSEASEAFAAAAAHAPQRADYHGYLGLAQRGALPLTEPPAQPSGEPLPSLTRAAESFASAAALAPAAWRWIYELGLTQQQIGQHHEAIAAFDRAFELADRGAKCLDDEEDGRTPEDLTLSAPTEQIRRRRARSAAALGRIAAARADLEQVQQRTPADHALLGRIALEMDDAPAAHAALECAAAADPHSSEIQLLLGRALAARGQAKDAVEALERAAESRPDDATVAAALSDAYLGAGRHERALNAASRSVRLDSSSATAHHRLASLYASAGRYHEARASLINALTLDQQRPAWHALMGEICTRLGMTEAARNAYQRAAAADPNVADYHYQLAQVLERQGKSAEAASTLTAAIKLAPGRGSWHYELGRMQQAAGEHAAAIEQIAAAVQYAPEHASHWLALANAQQQRQDSGGARETLERAIGQFGEEASLHNALGAIIEHGGETDLARWHYEIAATSAPDVAEHHWRLGRAQLDLGQSKSARVSLERALALDGQSAAAHEGLARIHVEANDAPAALIHMHRAAELDATNAAYQAQLGDVLLQLRRYEEARLAYERAVRIVPDDAEIQARYGEMSLNLNHNQEALAAFERAIERAPDEPRYHYLAGRAHRRLKQYTRAVERLRRAVKLSPGYRDAIVELSTLGPLAFMAQHLGRGEEAA